MAVNHRNFNVTGNLTADPQQITTRNGDPMTVFDLAQNTRVRDEAGNWGDGPTNYFSVGVTDQRLARNVAASLHKGDRVNVAGTLQSSPYVRNNGEPDMNHRIFADDVSPSLRWHTAAPQPDGLNAQHAASAHAAPASAGPVAGTEGVVDTWATAEPGSGGLSR